MEIVNKLILEALAEMASEARLVDRHEQLEEAGLLEDKIKIGGQRCAPDHSQVWHLFVTEIAALDQFLNGSDELPAVLKPLAEQIASCMEKAIVAHDVPKPGAQG